MVTLIRWKAIEILLLYCRSSDAMQCEMLVHTNLALTGILSEVFFWGGEGGSTTRITRIDKHLTHRGQVSPSFNRS
jgi:hypothetical protein